MHLYVVNESTEGNEFKRQAVARFDVGFNAASDLIAYGKFIRSDDIRLLPSSYWMRAMFALLLGVVLDRYKPLLPHRWCFFEIYQSVLSSDSAALVTNGRFFRSCYVRNVFEAYEERSFGLLRSYLFKKSERTFLFWRESSAYKL